MKVDLATMDVEGDGLCDVFADELRALVRVARAAKVFMITAPPEQYRTAADELLAALSDIEDSAS